MFLRHRRPAFADKIARDSKKITLRIVCRDSLSTLEPVQPAFEGLLGQIFGIALPLPGEIPDQFSIQSKIFVLRPARIGIENCQQIIAAEDYGI